MVTERLVTISRDNIPAGRSPGRPKIRWSDLILEPGGTAYNKEKDPCLIEISTFFLEQGLGSTRVDASDMLTRNLFSGVAKV